MTTRSYLIRNELSGPAALAFAETISRTPLEGIRRVSLSLGRAAQIDVLGVAVIVRIYSQLLARGVAFQMTDVPERVRAQLQLIGLDRLVVAAAPAASTAVAAPAAPDRGLPV